MKLKRPKLGLENRPLLVLVTSLILGVFLFAGSWEGTAVAASVKIAWDPSPTEGVTDYIVHLGVRSGIYSRVFHTGGKTDATLGGLKEGVTYYCTVKAMNWFSWESEFSEEVEYAGPCLGHTLGLGMEKLSFPGQGARLRLSALAGRKYHLEMSEDLQSWRPLGTSLISSAHTILEFVDATNSPAGQRFYRVRATGPYSELDGALTVVPVEAPERGATIGFFALASKAYEIQRTEDGSLWKPVWSTAAAEANGWIEIFDRQTNSAVQVNYRLLAALEVGGFGGETCPDPSNRAPILSEIPNLETHRNSPTRVIRFHIDDPDTPIELLTLSVSTSDPDLIPEGNVILGGSGTERTLRIRPAPGRWGSATVDLFASDGNNSSATAFKVNVQYYDPPSSRVAVDTTGGGTIRPDLNDHLLNVGAKYTVTAVPEAGQIFFGWKGDIQSSSPTLTFVMTPNLVLEAMFIDDPFLAVRGSFTGLFREEDAVRPETAGSLVLTATASGAYSGKLALGGKSHSFAGQLGFDRKATNQVKRGKSSPLSLELELASGEPMLVTGRIIGDGWQAMLSGYGSSPDAPRDPGLAGFAPRYTALIEGQSGPDGFGYGTATLDKRGSITFAGTLADGTKVVQKSRLSDGGHWALSVRLHKGKGSLLGWSRLESTNDHGSIDGTIDWVKPPMPGARQYPEGFSVRAALVGSEYVRPAKGARVVELIFGDITFSGGNLTRAFTNAFELSDRNKVSNLSSNKLSLAFKTSSGLFSGSVTEPDTHKSYRFQGAVLQRLNAGGGFLVGSNRNARVSFGL